MFCGLGRIIRVDGDQIVNGSPGYRSRFRRHLVTGIREAGRLLEERQLAADRITALAEELELRTDILVFVLGRGGDL